MFVFGCDDIFNRPYARLGTLSDSFASVGANSAERSHLETCKRRINCHARMGYRSERVVNLNVITLGLFPTSPARYLVMRHESLLHAIRREQSDAWRVIFLGADRACKQTAQRPPIHLAALVAAGLAERAVSACPRQRHLRLYERSTLGGKSGSETFVSSAFRDALRGMHCGGPVSAISARGTTRSVAPTSS